MKKLYVYKGAVYNQGTIYKNVLLYVHAASVAQAERFLRRRLRLEYGMPLQTRTKNVQVYKDNK